MRVKNVVRFVVSSKLSLLFKDVSEISLEVDVKVNKFSFLILTLVICACSVFVSAKEDKSKFTNKSSIEKVPCQQKANPLFQATPIAQFNNDISEINSGTPINNGSPLFAFAMPQPILAFQTYETFDGIPTKGGPQYSWACVAACIAIMCGANPTNPLFVTNCLNSCVIN